MSLYADLGIGPKANDAQIAHGFRLKAKECHPDLHEGPEAAEAFARISFAKEVLLDPKRRAHYDRTGEAVKLQPDNAIVPMMTALSGAFSAVMGALLQDGLDPRGGDMVAAMGKALRQEEAAVEKGIVDAEGALAKMRGLAGRFERPAAGEEDENRLEAMLSSQIAGLEQQLLDLKSRAVGARQAHDHLKEYVYRMGR